VKVGLIGSMAENSVLRRIFEFKREDATKLHNEELHNLTTSLRIIRMIKSKRLR
jgi:hypothetical protein